MESASAQRFSIEKTTHREPGAKPQGLTLRGPPGSERRIGKTLVDAGRGEHHGATQGLGLGSG